MERTEPQAIGDIIRQAMESMGHADTFDAERLSQMWPQVVGPGINRFTEKRFVSRTTLHVFLTSAPLKGELMFRRQSLVDALNAAVGRRVITEIIFH